MQRIKTRQKHNDKFKNAVREINNLKHELREIKTLIKEIVKSKMALRSVANTDSLETFRTTKFPML